MKGARHDFRHARRIVDLGRPFGHRAEHGAVIELLERLALLHVARHLADEHDDGRRILLGDVDARRGIGRARPAGDEDHARPAGRLADGLRHHAGAAFLSANRHREVAVMERIEHREIALAGHAEHVLHAMDAQLIDQHLGGGAHIVLGAHVSLLLAWHFRGDSGIYSWRLGPALFRPEPVKFNSARFGKAPGTAFAIETAVKLRLTKARSGGEITGRRGQASISQDVTEYCQRGISIIMANTASTSPGASIGWPRRRHPSRFSLYRHRHWSAPSARRRSWCR